MGSVMSLENFTFQNPVKILFGKDCIEKLGGVIKENGINKVLILLGSGSSKTNGVYDRVLKMLKENGISSIEVWGVQPNPLISKVREAVSVAKDEKNGVQAILAVGGGSVIDSAKATAYGAKYDGFIYFQCNFFLFLR
jgi:alcohol dehydrogenase YqhD (iron-dependent ADH family)